MGVVPPNKHVLVVDDDSRIRDGLVAALRDEGFVVSAAKNGREALSFLRREDTVVDVILLDLMMPVMDGWAFRVQQRSDSTLAHIPVIAQSASGSSQAEAIDAAAYLRKPFALLDLIEAIDRVTQTSVPQETAAAEVQTAALRALSAAMSHEIGNPLSYALMNIEELAEKLPQLTGAGQGADLADLATDARHGVRRIAEAIGDVRRVAVAARAEGLTAADFALALTTARTALPENAPAVVLDLRDAVTLPILAPLGWPDEIATLVFGFGLQAAADSGVPNTLRVIGETLGDTATVTLSLDQPVPAPTLEQGGIRLVLCQTMILSLGGKLSLGVPTGALLSLTLPLTTATSPDRRTTAAPSAPARR